jgi:predicted Zn-dependent peptidase
MVQCTKSKYDVKTQKDKNGYVYEQVNNDPYGVRMYTLKNGLKVYLSVNKDEPRIQTYIAVKAGSSYDPSETTGLAHYLEHMMFKGSNEIGAIDWETEKVLLSEISDLFEQHKATENAEEKKAIYRKIDSVSQIASKLVAANEYDKLIKGIGAKGTNAYTSNERTVYMNDIPSNELEKWLKIEKSRFGQLVLRLFHTELETVYEEFNMGQDNDDRQAYYTFMQTLFPNHVYGTQTTIGKPEHLKNPSMVNIHNYFNKYYVSNNMAICMSGDLDFEETVALIDKHFGQFERSMIEPVKHSPAGDIKGAVSVDVFGPKNEFMQMGYRMGGMKSQDRKYAVLIEQILSNSKAGLIDLNLVQAQKVLHAGAGSNFMKEYGFLIFYGYPKQGQTLEEIRDLLLGEIEKIKKGEFDDWMMTAAINNLKLRTLRALESNGRAHMFVSAFTDGVDWSDYLAFYDELEKVTKEDLVKFANKTFKDNYVTVFKRTGKNENVVKVEKPEITAINIDRSKQSEFFKALMAEPSRKIEPVFVDFKQSIETSELSNGIKVNYIKNTVNPLFELYYLLPMGKDHNKKLEVAVNYLPYLGTDKYSPAELQQELFKNGLSFGVQTSADESYVYMSGLEDNLNVGIELLEHILLNLKPDQEAYNDYVKGIVRMRMNKKQNKDNILWDGLFNYGKYGSKSAATDILSNKELAELNPDELTEILKNIYKYNHEVFYYGQKNISEITQLLNQKRKLATEFLPAPSKTVYAERETKQNEVFVTHYDMVQSSIVLMSKGQKFDASLFPKIRLFNEFYGSGLSSIVFQEMREARGLAYSAWAQFSVPNVPEESHYTFAFVGTQPDKIKIATDAMVDLMNNMPSAEKQFAGAKESIMKQIETSRTVRKNIFWTYRRNIKRGIDYDLNKNVYDEMQTTDMETFRKFFDENIKGKKYSFLVQGNKAALDMKTLSKLGVVKELTLEELFNY